MLDFFLEQMERLRVHLRQPYRLDPPYLKSILRWLFMDTDDVCKLLSCGICSEFIGDMSSSPTDNKLKERSKELSRPTVCADDPSYRVK